MNCKLKRLYATKEIADRAVKAHNNDVFKRDEDRMNAYFCNTHKGWHVGHRKPLEQLSSTQRIHAILSEVQHGNN